MTDRPRRRSRRAVLAALAVGSLAGCSGISGSSDGSGKTPTASSTTTTTPDAGTPGDPTIETEKAGSPEGSETPDETETPDQPTCTRFVETDTWTVWEGSAETVRNAERDACGVRLHCEPPETRIAAMYEYDAPMDLSGSHLTVPIRFPESVATSALEVWVAAPDLHSRYTYHVRPRPGDGWLHLPFATPDATTGGPDPSDVRGVKFIQHTDSPSQITVERPQTVERPPEPTILFTFDGGRSSVVETALPVLEEFGFPGSVGVAPEQVGTSGHLDRSELETLSARGWDVMNQPRTVDPLRAYSRETQSEIITSGKEWLEGEGFEDGARFFVYPYSESDPSSRSVVRTHHLLGFAGTGTSTWRPPTPERVGRIDGADPGAVTAYVDRVERFGGVLPLAFGGTGDGNSSLSRSDFREIVDYVETADVTCLGVSQWYESAFET